MQVSRYCVSPSHACASGPAANHAGRGPTCRRACPVSVQRRSSSYTLGGGPARPARRAPTGCGAAPSAARDAAAAAGTAPAPVRPRETTRDRRRQAPAGRAAAAPPGPRPSARREAGPARPHRPHATHWAAMRSGRWTGACTGPRAGC
eukprot:scaffold1307_cov87-Phaeocystis_antarctica.AAC.5